MRSERVRNTVSAGGVVYRRSQEGLEIVLCGRSDPGTWSLPKGTPNSSETIKETALREVHEETGLQTELEKPLGNISYWFTQAPNNVRYHKTVYFYLMVERGGSVDLHDPEFDTVRWFSVQEALEVMTHPNEATVVRRALDALAERGLARG